jgi:hypothetical protein
MTGTEIHPAILAQIKKVTGKRPLAVINHILEHGQITTQELKDIYRYNHPPRAARDVRECGIPLVTVRVVGTDGRKIGAYTFGDPDKIERNKLAGRMTFSKAFKRLLLDKQGPKCAITGEPYEPRYLSIDHRIPYEVAGERAAGEDHPEAFMLIPAAAQRQKSWSCEHCRNWREIKDQEICRRCYWASPEQYDHIAMEQRRRVDLSWIGVEVGDYERLCAMARNEGKSVAEIIKDILRRITAT